MKAVGFLQNPWSPFYAGSRIGERWPRESWLHALAASPTGRRLKLLEHPDLEIYYDNASPVVCANPRDIMKPDLGHMCQILDEQKPNVVITFGAIAAAAMEALYEIYQLPILMLPHPAYRLLTNALYTHALSYLLKGFSGRRMFKQQRENEISVLVK